MKILNYIALIIGIVG
ncbi:MAG: hypothetical protein RR441_09725, partial [Longicatena sp.]